MLLRDLRLRDGAHWINLFRLFGKFDLVANFGAFRFWRSLFHCSFLSDFI